MAIPYQELNENNCSKLAKFSWSEIISLTGLLGIHTYQEIVNAGLECSIEENLITIEFESYLVKQMMMTINLTNRIIRNSLFISTRVKDGLGLPRVISQVKAARDLGFKHISLFAYGNYAINEQYSGYLVWGKYGYIMSDPSQKATFRKLMYKHKRKEDTLYKLQLDRTGNDLWKFEGFSWYGKFITSRNSTCFNILSETIKAKGLAEEL